MRGWRRHLTARIWLAAEVYAYVLSRHRPHSTVDAQLLGLLSLLGAVLTASWLYRHRRVRPAAVAVRLRADPLGSLAVLGWVPAMIIWELAHGSGDVAKAGLFIAFAISAAWVIRQHPRAVLIGVLVVLASNWASSRR
jgi:hypothetical protein